MYLGFVKKALGAEQKSSEPRVIKQKTLKSDAFCSGIGLHSGKEISMTLLPADINSGIVFKRTDVEGQEPLIPATWDRVVDTRMCTVLGNEDGVTIGTVEHLMAALAGCGIDNALIEINGPEIPIMDGSAAPFVSMVERAGIKELDAPRRVIRILKEVSADGDDYGVSVSPGDGVSLGFEIDFDHSVISRQSMRVGLVNGTFKKELSRARTFGFLHEVEQLRAAGLAKGGSLDNAIVVSDDKVMNEDGLRFDDEFVRHKILDALGDLYLAGNQIIGHFHGERSGHAANNALLKALFSDQENWEYDVMYTDEVEPLSPLSNDPAPVISLTPQPQGA
jgi:UDP-3-O-[3-hydroxymyristoyl] N-acetylglucosamine deacetylase